MENAITEQPGQQSAMCKQQWDKGVGCLRKEFQTAGATVTTAS